MRHKFKTKNIKGKEYVEVNERIKYFRESGNYEGFALLSEIVAFDDQHCIVKATVLNAEGNPISNGIAHETRTSSAVNKTSMLENGETSAWGRALGNLGIGIDTSIATAEEVGQAIKVQDAPQATSNAPEQEDTRKWFNPLNKAGELTEQGENWLKVVTSKSKDAAIALAKNNYKISKATMDWMQTQ